MTMITVLLVDKPAIALQDLRALVEAEPGLAVVSQAADLYDAVDLAWQLKPDVVVMAWSFLQSLEAIRTLRSQAAGPRIVVLTAQRNPGILFELLQAGAHGLLLAGTAGVTLVNAIRAVHGGGAFVSGDAAALMIPHYINRSGRNTPITPLESLSRRERQVLNLVVDGKPVTGPVNLTSGAGPFRNEDADVCADMRSSDGSIHYDMAPIAVTCVDANNDGVVDPMSTCTSWDNSSNTTCSDVSQAFPGTNSKCSCSDAVPNPPILIYRGYDFGDLPDTYGTLLASNGAQHAIQDTNNDGTPNVQGGVPAIWLGPAIDFSPNGETNGQPSANADGDDINSPGPGINPSDEDGVMFTGPWFTDLPPGGKVTVAVSASDPNACAGNKCYAGYWIDWDGSGTFNPAAYPSGEYYVAPVIVGTNNLTFLIPSTWTTPLFARFRLYYESTGVQGSYLPTGLSINGEVEDHLSNIVPSAVALASFAATCQADTPVITWETLSEVDTAGFNVWRSDTTGAPETRLNASMIPAHPGSTQGYSYNWTDSTAQVGQIYYYWLEDVDLNGATNLNGPIEAICTSPTAVTVNGLEANGSSGSTAVWWAPLIALIAGIALAGLLSRRSLVK